jgi:hypothetical protein
MRTSSMKNYGFVLMFICIIFSYANVFAQQIAIKIIVKDNAKQLLPNTSLSINDKKLKADNNGTVVQSLSAGKITITASAVNHYNFIQTFTLTTDTTLQIVLQQRQSLLNAVVVRSSKNISANQMGVQMIL